MSPDGLIFRFDLMDGLENLWFFAFILGGGWIRCFKVGFRHGWVQKRCVDCFVLKDSMKNPL